MRLVENTGNMVIIEFGTWQVLFSYKTPVAALDINPGGRIYETEEYHSTTTSKHIGKFIRSHPARKVEVISQERLYKLADDQKVDRYI